MSNSLLSIYPLTAAFILFLLLLNFKKDKLRFLPAKAVHLLVLLFLGYIGSEGISGCIILMKSFQSMAEVFSTDLPLIPANWNFGLLVAAKIWYVLLTLCLFRMARRKIEARKPFFVLLVGMGLFLGVDLYRASIHLGLLPEVADWVVLGLPTIMGLLIAFALIRLYSSRFMLAFFNNTPIAKPFNRNEKVLDSEEVQTPETEN